MLFSLSSAKWTSLGLMPGVVATLAYLGGGCVLVTDNADSARMSAPTSPAQFPIDMDKTIQPSGGQGVGVFVQYATGGHWTISMACDTTTSGMPCDFDVFVTPLLEGAAVSNPLWQHIEGAGSTQFTANTLHVFAETAMAVDAITFDSPPGNGIEVDVALDGEAQSRFIYWIGEGVLHTGSPTNPVDFVPSAP